MSTARASRMPVAVTIGLVAMLALGLALNGLLGVVQPAPHNETVLQHARDVLAGKGGDDSWEALDLGLEHVREEPGKPLYTTVFFESQYRFQYPPSSLFVLMGLHAIAPERVQVSDDYAGPWPAINIVLGWFFLLVTAAATAVLLEIGLSQAIPGAAWRKGRLVRIVTVGAMALTFYPVVKPFTLGQIQVWINALVAVALLAAALGRPAVAGALVGLVALLKPHYGLIGVWALLRRQWRFAVGLAVVGAAGGIVSLAVFGLANHLDYLKVLSFLSQHGEAYFPNQSINGLLNRLVGVGGPAAQLNLELLQGQFPPWNPLVYGATVVSSVALLGVSLLVQPAGGRRGGVLDLAIMALSITIASPIAWEHHYGIALPIFAIALAGSLAHPGRLAWLAAAYLLVAIYIPVTKLLAPTYLNVLQSYVLAGALMLLGVLYACARRETGADASPVRAKSPGSEISA